MAGSLGKPDGSAGNPDGSVGVCGCAVEVVGAVDGAALADALGAALAVAAGLVGFCVTAGDGVIGAAVGAAVVACSAGGRATGSGGVSGGAVGSSIVSEAAGSSLLPVSFLQHPMDPTPSATETHAAAAATMICFIAPMLPPIDAHSNGFVTSLVTLTGGELEFVRASAEEAKAVQGENGPVFICG